MPQPPVPPEETNLWSTDHQLDPYTAYEINTSYGLNTGILQLPVAGPPGTPPVLIQLHAGAQRKTVAVGGRRAGLPPLMPSSTSLGIDGGVLANFVLSPQSPVLDADGETYVYNTGATYVYYLSSFIRAEDGFRMGASPVYTTNPSENKLGSSTFSTNIL
jgi:hypothetical protein